MQNFCDNITMSMKFMAFIAYIGHKSRRAPSRCFKVILRSAYTVIGHICFHAAGERHTSGFDRTVKADLFLSCAGETLVI